jgi:RNA ligase
MKIMYKPDFIELDKLVESGHLAKKELGDLVLYNYSDLTTFQKLWNEHTINSRGTIYNKLTGETISKALSKFKNFGELDLETQQSALRARKFEVFTKEDGSCGICAFYNGKWNVTTRGSFESEQAIKATQMLSNYNLSQLNRSFTYIVEIIYPENRIIVDYGSKESLVLLACIETKTGREADLEALVSHVPFPITQSHKFKSIDDVIEAVSKMDANSEGYVVKLRNGLRFKVKSPEYLKLARLMSRMSPLTLWENMKDGKVSTKLMQSIPEEFRADYEVIQQELESQYMHLTYCISQRVDIVESNIDAFSQTRMKDIGLYLNDNPDELNCFVFPMVHQKFSNVDKMIMREIRPTGNIL